MKQLHFSVVPTGVVVGMTALVVAVIIRPRLAQLRAATTNLGGAALFFVGLVVAVAALTPLTRLRHVPPWMPPAIAGMVLLLGSTLVLSFDERDGSDGLFIVPLLLGSALLLVLSAGVTRRLGRREPR